MAKDISLDLSRDTLLAIGPYKLRIEAVDVKDGRDAPYLALRLRTSGATIFHNVSWAESAKFFRGQFLDALGLPTEGKIKPQQLRGLTLWASVGIGEYNGQPKNTIENWLLPEVGEKLAESAAKTAAGNKTFAEKMPDPSEEADYYEEKTEEKDAIPIG